MRMAIQQPTASEERRGGKDEEGGGGVAGAGRVSYAVLSSGQAN